MQKIRPWLYIGTYRDTVNPSLLKVTRISAMLQLAEPAPMDETLTLYLPIEDGVALPVDRFAEGLRFIADMHKQDHTILVACGAGISRSTSFAIGALKEYEGLTLLDATTHIKRVYPMGMPHPALWQSLCTYYNEDIPYLSLLRMGYTYER